MTSNFIADNVIKMSGVLCSVMINGNFTYLINILENLVEHYITYFILRARLTTFSNELVNHKAVLLDVSTHRCKQGRRY